jgi:hypothetical protein
MASLRDLIKTGAIDVGDVLVWEKKQSKTVHTVTVQANGTLKTPSGTIYRTPSNAAKELNGGIAINGWRVWKLQRNSKSLLEIREASGFKVAKRSANKPLEGHNPQ